MGARRERNRDSRTITQGELKLKGPGALVHKGLLVVVSANLFGSSFVIDRRETTVGRGEGCGVRLDDPLVSREHCVFTVDQENNFFVEDLGSKNRTYLNKKPVRKKRQLFYGDRLLMGETILRFFLEEEVRTR
jgi:pSer/pThr/pTyr-binding forkhead associated (FHA) protein